ncbi:MAG TPA: hypothetical protein VII93_00055 [Anaerolineales bacterium]
MHVIVDFTVVPVGTCVSLSLYIAECKHVLEESGIYSYKLMIATFISSIPPFHPAPVQSGGRHPAEPRSDIC